MKQNRNGKAAIFKQEDIRKIRRAFDSSHHRCIFEIALFTGERMGAIVQLQVSDVYRDPLNSIPHDLITFAARTRKARPGGARETRQVPLHPDLKSFLESYKPSLDGYLFPGRVSKESTLQVNHITYDSVYQYWQRKFSDLGIDHKGFSTHSSRRWLITKLVRSGTDLKTVQNITGHKNVNVLLGYVGESLELSKNALAAVSV
ncbi:site-specific recombinase XerD [Xenococcus sp. PCC 7305]|uniref:tyrosine-type recombinase/integrase n=1 Tax=Xenococcus sp. PCC 7305 TaxID=102125 RepID=UPI0002ABF746|nr:site-specific integrase [Xenococcus sp. PCC 7305]ELS04815.1 site-specific recombinase XerD [Xenococcus sp. PCC 7305]